MKSADYLTYSVVTLIVPYKCVSDAMTSAVLYSLCVFSYFSHSDLKFKFTMTQRWFVIGAHVDKQGRTWTCCPCSNILWQRLPSVHQSSGVDWAVLWLHRWSRYMQTYFSKILSILKIKKTERTKVFYTTHPHTLTCTIGSRVAGVNISIPWLAGTVVWAHCVVAKRVSRTLVEYRLLTLIDIWHECVRIGWKRRKMF